MTILLLKGYNNYFNRIVKKENSITDYKEASTSYLEYGDVNFVPNDGILTSIIVGGPTQQKIETVEGQEVEKILDFESGGSPDYFIVHNNVTISSRWFIIECVRVRAGQYQLALKRDVLADFYDDYKNSPCFIEKGTIDDLNNYLLYNSENYPVNQIKTSENLIKDVSGVAWVVGYVASNLLVEQATGNLGTIELNSSGYAGGSTILNSNLYTSFWLTNTNGNQTYAVGNSGDNKFNYTFNTSTKQFTYTINIPSLANGSPVLRYNSTAPNAVSGDNYSVGISDIRAKLTDAPYCMFCIPFGTIHLETANINTTKEAALEIAFEMSKDLGSNLYDIQILPYCPRQDMIGSGKIYEVLGTANIDYNYIYSGNTIKSILIWCTKSTDGFTVAADTVMEVSRPTDATTKTKTVNSTNARCNTSDNYSKVSFTDTSIIDLANVTVTGVTVSKDSYNSASQGIRSFDYNPVTGYIMGEIYTPDFPTGSTTGWTAKITFTYNEYINPKYLDYKISNECDLYRLTSPNYNGQFEWSLAKSTGEATYFNVDFTYKPFQPYIHVTPNFAKLYGQDFDDARGLICGGDFSLPVTSDAWTQYQIQNKTYQEMFDRQIQNMDVNNQIASEKQSWASAQNLINTAWGAYDSTMSGARGGASGAIIGGTKGLSKMIQSVASAEFSSDWLVRQTQENRDYAYDMFNYGIQNVQALPYSLTKVSAYNANNKIFPMVEYFTCSDREKQAFKDKLQYNGMSVNVIGQISDYVKSGELRFIKGQLIRLDSIADDSHIANEIYNEINKGFYI